jgi:hypothetical protein
MFASKAGAYQSGARKYWTVVEVDGSGKHSKVTITVVKFYITGSIKLVKLTI